jgi:hypothetical protein
VEPDQDLFANPSKVVVIAGDQGTVGSGTPGRKEQVVPKQASGC